MMWSLLTFLALAQPAPGGTGGTQVTAADARGASAARLRAMLGAHAAGPPLGRAQVLAAVDQRHPKARAMLLDVERARGEAQRARGAFDPAVLLDAKGAVAGYYGYAIADGAVSWDPGPVSFQAGWRFAGDMGANGLPAYHDEYETLGGGELRFGVAVPLEGFWTDPERTGRLLADLDVDGSVAMADATVLALRQKAVASWAKWVAAGRLVALEEALLDIANQRQRAVDVRIQLGDLADIERVRNEQIVVEREADLALARGAFLGATEDLALYLRSPDGAPVRAGAERLPDRGPAPVRVAQYPEDPIRLALDVHPLLRAARVSVDQREAEMRLARQAMLLPEFALVGEISQDLPNEPDPKDSLEPAVAMVGFKGKIPTLNRKDRGKAAAAEAKLDKARADLTWLQDQVHADVVRAIAQEEAALTAWKAAARSVDLALTLQEAEQRRFDVGDIDLLRLWQVEQSTAKAVADEIKAWSKYQIAVADLEAAVGTRLLDAL
jgi:outer membrane protein TolC